MSTSSVLTPAALAVSEPARARRTPHFWHGTALLTLLLALGARLGVILRTGGIHGIIGYDCGVYFSGADAVLHGRLPYRDFTMVHPPGITLVLLPFAALTRFMTDWHAFIVATLAFCLLGTANAALVMTVCRRFGMGRSGAITAGVFYAAWFGSVAGEFEIKLEPLGNAFLLCGLLALLRAQRRPSRWSDLLAGSVIGIPVVVKIWWIVPVLLLIGWHGFRRRSGLTAAKTLAGAALSATVVCLPFFIADPSGMLNSVVFEQLGRPRTQPIATRLATMSSIPDLLPHLSTGETGFVAVVFAIVLAALAGLAWRAAPRVRIMVALTVIQLVVLLAAPSWFTYYSDYVAVGLSVVVGAAATSVSRAGLARPHGAAVAGMAVLLTSLITLTGVRAVPAYAGARQLTEAVESVPCVMSNNPTLLLRLDALTRGLEHGCPNWIDVSGRKYGPDNPAKLRAEHTTWAAQLTDYLLSGDAVAIQGAHPRKVGTALAHQPVLARAGGHTIHWAK